MYHVRNFIGRENLITHEQTNELAHIVRPDTQSFNCFIWATLTALYYIYLKAMVSVHRPVHSKIMRTYSLTWQTDRCLALKVLLIAEVFSALIVRKTAKRLLLKYRVWLARLLAACTVNQLRAWAPRQSAYAQWSPLYPFLYPSLYPSLYPYVTHVINYTRPSLSFPYCKRRKAGQGLGMRLGFWLRKAFELYLGTYTWESVLSCTFLAIQYLLKTLVKKLCWLGVWWKDRQNYLLNPTVCFWNINWNHYTVEPCLTDTTQQQTSGQFWKSWLSFSSLQYLSNLWIADILLLHIMDSFRSPNCMQIILEKWLHSNSRRQCTNKGWGSKIIG